MYTALFSFFLFFFSPSKTEAKPALRFFYMMSDNVKLMVERCETLRISARRVSCAFVCLCVCVCVCSFVYLLFGGGGLTHAQ